MAQPTNQEKLQERTLLLSILAFFLFSPPLVIAWAWGGIFWLTPYLIWLLLIALGAWLHFRYGRHDL